MAGLVSLGMARAMPYACLHRDPPRPDRAGGHDPRIARLGSGGGGASRCPAGRLVGRGLPGPPAGRSRWRVKEEGGGSHGDEDEGQARRRTVGCTGHRH